MAETCTWPACICRATGAKCSNFSEKKGAKNKGETKRYSIPKRSENGKHQALLKRDQVQRDMHFYITEVWPNVSHFCACGCGTLVTDATNISIYHHYLEKENYDEFRHEVWNMGIVTPRCHNQYHSNPDNKPVLRDKRAQLLKDLEEKGHSFNKNKIIKKDVYKNRNVVKK